MIEITELPPQEPPKQLTARHAIETLGEHYTAFLLANNLSGWKPEEGYVLRDDKLADILVTVSLSTGLYLGLFKRMTRKIVKLTQNGGSKVPQHLVMDMIAKALGYPGYLVAYKCRSTDDFIENLWPLGASMNLAALETERGMVVGDPLANDRLLQRYRLNKTRDQSLREADPARKDKLRVQSKTRLQTRE